MKSEIIFQDGEHMWIVFGRDPKKPEEVIDTNEYVIINKGEAVLLDPGGTAIFPQVLTELTKYVKTENIKAIVASHQDPDIASSLAMWFDLCPDVKVYCSWLWTGFIAHFGMGTTLKLDTIPDEGMELSVGNTGANLYLVPAHYCHSSGFFSGYDPKADILFSGDLGAAMLPDGYESLYVENFDQHIKYMNGFHKRWMPSTSALRAWVRRVRTINPSMIAPQHGAIFRGDDVKLFLDWLDSIEVGKWNSEQEDRDIYSTVWMKWKK